MKKTLLSAFLAIATWMITQCGLVTPAHACCPPNTGHHKVTAALPACCLIQPAAQASSPSGPTGAGDGGGVLVASNYFSAPDWRAGAQPLLVSRLALRHVPDQSNRHSDLSVWLN